MFSLTVGLLIGLYLLIGILVTFYTTYHAYQQSYGSLDLDLQVTMAMIGLWPIVLLMIVTMEKA